MAVTALMGVACAGEDKVGDDEKSSGEKTEGIKVTTDDASDITYCSARLNATCSITNAKGEQCVAIFYYGTLNELDNIKVKGEKIVVDMISESTKSFSMEIKGLEVLTKYFFVAYVIIDGKEYGGSVKSFTTKDTKENGYEFVDLGLSVKWATWNVGASHPWEGGEPYAWGEIETKSSYTWTNYKFRTSGDSYDNVKFNKYNTSSSYGTVDNKTTLDSEDDVAHVKWGGNWRMPTQAELDELRNNCIWTWFDSGNTEFHGKAGYKVTSRVSGYTDRFIFLPAAGYRGGTDLYYVGSYGHYLSSSLHTDLPYDGRFLSFINSAYLSTSYGGRYLGRSVRPVCP